MKIFALETDTEKMIKSLLSANESIVLNVRFHGILFAMACLRGLLVIALAVPAALLGLPLFGIVLAGVLLWLSFVIVRIVLRAYIDWKFDMLLVTSEKIVIVDQSSVFHRTIRQMNLENIATVHAETQFWNLLPFGILCFDLKEGVGQSTCLRYIPSASRVASVVSDAVTLYQRRRAIQAHDAAHRLTGHEQ